MTAPSPDLDQAIDWLQWHSPGGPWVLTAIHPDRPGALTRTFGGEAALELRAWLESQAPHRNIYFMVNPPLYDLTKKAERADVGSLAWLHVDIDPRAGEDIQEERQRALRILTNPPAGLPGPSAVISSGGGFQGFWRLTTPRAINGIEEHFEDAKLYNVALEEIFDADHCHNVDRIMRLPGTINWPNEKKRRKGRTPALAEVIYRNDEHYDLSSFPKAASSQRPRNGDPISLDAKANLERLPDRLRTLALHGCVPGEPPKPSRSENVFDFCCNGLRAGVSSDDLAAILVDPQCKISESVLEHGVRAREYARRQLDSAAAEISAEPLVLSKDEPRRSARQYVARYRPTLLRYNGDWLAHQNGAYVELEPATVRSEVYEMLDDAKCAKQADGEIKYYPFAPTRDKVSNVVDALEALTHRQQDKYSPPCWISGDGAPPNEILACRNGLLHLPSGALLPPSERFFTRNALAFDYNANAAEPLQWLGFLKQLWHNEAEVETLQEMFGYLIVPDTSQQKIFLLVGPKRSGKGTIGRMLRHLIGPANICAPTLDNVGGQFGLEPLIGKQLATVSDMRIGYKTDKAQVAENLLRISGEDDITAGRKYKTAWTGRLGVRFLIMTNDMPVIPDASGALASRFVPLMMTESFYGREDPGLEGKLVPELPGVLNWAIQGWRRLKARGHFVLPQASRDAISDLEDLGSPVKAFLRDRCTLQPNVATPKVMLYQAWCDWNDQRNGHAGDLARFAANLLAASERQIRSVKLTVDGARVPHFEGVVLQDSQKLPF